MAAPAASVERSALPFTADEQARVAAVTAPTKDFTGPEAFEARPAGAATRMGPAGPDAFAAPFANMDEARRLDFMLGEALFEKLWVEAPSATTASDGLGPLYNARACSACHPGNGRGRPPAPGEAALSLVLKVSVPAAHSPLDAETLTRYVAPPEPNHGHQIQTRGIAGVPAEARLSLGYTARPVTLGDGSVVHLRAPRYRLEGARPPLHPAALTSPRVAPQMIGLGLIEAIPAVAITARADPGDADGDGISGRANRVWSPELGRVALGRFGHKAAAATVRDQSMEALHTDIGLSNPFHPDPAGDCTPHQTACRAAPDGNTPAQDGLEAGRVVADLLTHYAAHIAVPARRSVDAPEVLRGKALFYGAGCAACHVPKHVTARSPETPETSFQLIWPYSDFLLHDMGPGLADHRPEGDATGREWRTAPLWGLGLTEAVSGHRQLLHDGRARGPLEAVLWHGGEAAPAREAVRLMPKADRDALMAFLASL